MISDSLRAKRMSHIGASDSAAILGINPYQTEYDVWLVKTSRAHIEVDNEVVAIGNMMESPLIDWVADIKGVRVIRNQYRVSKSIPILSATHDALVKGDPETFTRNATGIEAKTSGIGTGKTHGWGDAGSEEIPEHYYVQCQHQMLVSNLDRVWVPALLVYKGRCLYEVERNDELIDIMSDVLPAWWDKYVVNDIQPTNSTPSRDIIKYINRVDKSTKPIDGGRLEELIAAKEEIKQLTETCKSLECEIAAMTGDAEVGVASGVGSVSYTKSTRSSVDSKRLRADHPEIYAKMLRQTTVRTQRIRKETT